MRGIAARDKSTIDYLSQILHDLAPRTLEPRHRFKGNDLRLIARSLTFENLVSGAFEQIIENATGNKAVLTHLLYSLSRATEATLTPDRRTALVKQAEAITELVGALKTSDARRTVDMQSREVWKQLKEK